MQIGSIYLRSQVSPGALPTGCRPDLTDSPRPGTTLIRIRHGGWLFLAACFLAIYRVFPLGKSAGLAAFFVLSMILHEVGHALAAWYYRTPVHEVGLCLWGGYICYERPKNSLYHAVILASGMMMNLLLTVPFWFIPQIGPLVSVWNLILFVSSVLPLPWFDGGKLLKVCARQA